MIEFIPEDAYKNPDFFPMLTKKINALIFESQVRMEQGEWKKKYKEMNDSVYNLVVACEKLVEELRKDKSVMDRHTQQLLDFAIASRVLAALNR